MEWNIGESSLSNCFDKLLLALQHKNNPKIINV